MLENVYVDGNIEMLLTDLRCWWPIRLFLPSISWELNHHKVTNIIEVRNFVSVWTRFWPYMIGFSFGSFSDCQMIPLWMDFQIIQFCLNETFIEMLIFHYNWYESINWLDFNFSIQSNDFVIFSDSEYQDGFSPV